MNSKTTPYDEDRNQKHIRLAEAYQKGNAEAAGKLLTDFQPLLRKLAYDPIRQTFDEDLSQQLALVFLEKTKVYDAEKLPIFALYIKQQLKWGKIDWQRKEITYAKAECFDVDHSPEPVVSDPHERGRAGTAHRRHRSSSQGEPKGALSFHGGGAFFQRAADTVRAHPAEPVE